MEEQTCVDAAYIAKERLRVAKLYQGKRKGKFGTKDNFVNWWVEQYEKQNGCCIYCGTSILLISKLIKKQVLETRKIGNGRRGPHLELEKRNPRGDYEPKNCALACYYCNNDKSYIYSEMEYKNYFGLARANHFKALIQRLESR